MVNVTFAGVEQVESRIRLAHRELFGALEKAVVYEAEVIMAVAKERTPVDTGALRASGVVGPPQTDGRSIEVLIGFGGAAREYAVYVHENLIAHHPVGQAKFLESAVVQAVPTLGARIAARAETMR